MKIIQGDLILEHDTTFDESIIVYGSIHGKDRIRFSLTVDGNITAYDIDTLDINARNITAWNINALNINAKNIDARNIDAWNINAQDINALNINALDINAKNIDARDIICESRKKRNENDKTIACVFVIGRSKFTKRNWELEGHENIIL
jgi:hypothetical protein